MAAGEATFPNEAQRIAGLTDAAMAPPARAALSAWGQTFNLHRVLAHSPDTLAAWMTFGAHILRNNALDVRVRELVVLRVAWNARSSYEWGQHAGLCARLGIPKEDVARVPLGPDAPGWTPLEAALLRGVDQMMRGWSIDADVYRTLEGALTAQQLVDYVLLVGEFILVALTLNVFQIEKDPGLAPWPGEAAP